MRADRLALRCAACLAVAVALPAQAGDWQLADLMRTLASNRPHEATFVEKRYLSVLDRPLESSGELSFTPPDRLEKRTLKPRPESLIVDGDVLMVKQANGRRLTLNLQDRPEISALVDSIRGTLSGESSALQQVYSIELSGSADAWCLSLVPLRDATARVVSRIRIAGSQAELNSIEFDFADGDRSEMRIARVRTP